MLALGAVVMLTLAVVLTAAQPPAAAIVYVTVYAVSYTHLTLPTKRIV